MPLPALLQAMLNVGTVEQDHHDHAGEEDGTAHPPGSGRELANGFGITAGQHRYRIELLEGFGSQEPWPEHVGDHRVAETPGKIEKLCEQHSPCADHIQNQIDMEISAVHGHQEDCKRCQDDDPVGVGHTGHEQDGIGDEAHVDPPFDELLPGLQMDKVTHRHEDAKSCYRIIDFTQHHIGVIGDRIQQRQVTKVSAVQHIGDAKSGSVPGAGNQNAEDQDGQYRQNAAADDLPDVLLPQEEQRQEDEECEQLQGNGEHEIQNESSVVILHPAVDAPDSEVQCGNVIGTEYHDGGHEQVRGIEEDTGKKCILLSQSDGSGKAIQCPCEQAGEDEQHGLDPQHAAETLEHIDGCETADQIQREVPDGEQNIDREVIDTLYILHIGNGIHCNEFVVEIPDPSVEQVLPETDAHAGRLEDIVIDVAVE